MRRRDFISSFSKFSLMTATASLATAATSKGRDIAETSIDKLNNQFKTIKMQLDSLESNQRKMAKALILVAAVSTGFDLSLML